MAKYKKITELYLASSILPVILTSALLPALLPIFELRSHNSVIEAGKLLKNRAVHRTLSGKIFSGLVVE